ncbi:uncharacterized protein [Dermacentor andersoni]|uniref:uncharacterized protein n=1 Tax=Dermacentor andersoni TaxID=34620 RepID=UPI0024165881|nr:uncharacterized protein LOC126537806 [Dermacentor andersoni]
MHSMLMLLGSWAFLVFLSTQGDAAEGTTTVPHVRQKNATNTPRATTRLGRSRVPQKSAAIAVNITQKAQTFIETMNKTWHDISSWGMTSKYSFWAGKHNRFGERPISAHAGIFECDKEMSDDFDDDAKMAIFSWHIPKKICSPVPIYVNVTVAELKRGEFVEKDTTLNFNNRNKIEIRTPRRKRKWRPKGLDKVVEACEFTVNVTFHGWFAYETDDEVNGSRYYSVGIGVLQDKKNGLVRRRHNRLSYMIKGTFKRIIFSKKYP